MATQTWRKSDADAKTSSNVRPSYPKATKDARPGFRLYLVRVRAVTDLSPHMRRVTFTGPQLQWFGTDGYDQRIKLMFPLADDGHSVGPWGDPHLFDPRSVARGGWWDQWRALPAERRNPIRTYTVRGVDVQAREITVDFARHGALGPAGAFAERVAVGDTIVVIGPDGRSLNSALGIDFHCGMARRVLLAGDETAMPAIGAIIDTLAREHRFGIGDGCVESVLAMVEMPDEDDFAALPDPVADSPAAGHVEIRRFARGSRLHGQALFEAVQAWVAKDGNAVRGHVDGNGHAETFADVDVDRGLLWEVTNGPTDGDIYAWVAGEAAMVRDIRRLLVRDRGMPRSSVAFMGYWRNGRHES